MTPDDRMSALWYLLIALLPLSALIARRLPLGRMLRMILIWLGIFAAGLILATLWARNRSAIGDFVADTGFGGNQVTGNSVAIARADDGHYYANVSINGITRRMLIDTGATQTVLTRATASAAGVVTEQGFGVAINTVNGGAIAQRAMVRTLDIGPLHTSEMMVLVADKLDVDLLGADFLERLKSWRAEGNRLILEPRRSS